MQGQARPRQQVEEVRAQRGEDQDGFMAALGCGTWPGLWVEGSLALGPEREWGL